MSEYPADLVLLFSFYAFAGWVLETVYASISEKRFVNRGFLTGPFCPIYGIGALLIIQSSNLLKGIAGNTPVLLTASIMLAIISATALEYLTGYALEKIFNCKWWDYSNESFNIKGRICLKYSLLWGILAYILLTIVNPLVATGIATVPLSMIHISALILIVYFVLDIAHSVAAILDLNKLLSAYGKTSLDKFLDKLLSHRRILLAFPQLHFHNFGKLNNEIRSLLHDRLEKIKVQIKN